jgi:hypothetical protein
MAIPSRIEEAENRHPVRLVIVDDHIFIHGLVAPTAAQQRTRYRVLAAVGTAAEVAVAENSVPRWSRTAAPRSVDSSRNIVSDKAYLRLKIGS